MCLCPTLYPARLPRCPLQVKPVHSTEGERHNEQHTCHHRDPSIKQLRDTAVHSRPMPPHPSLQDDEIDHLCKEVHQSMYPHYDVTGNCLPEHCNVAHSCDASRVVMSEINIKSGVAHSQIGSILYFSHQCLLLEHTASLASNSSERPSQIVYWTIMGSSGLIRQVGALYD
jgi:hypothetical protein